MSSTAQGPPPQTSRTSSVGYSRVGSGPGQSNFHVHPLDRIKCRRCPLPAEVHHQFLCLTTIKLQVVQHTPLHEGVHDASALSLHALPECSSQFQSCLRTSAGVRTEKNRKGDRTALMGALWGPCGVHHRVRHAVLCLLWPTTQIIHKPVEHLPALLSACSPAGQARQY